jgi:F-type H+-transporting ATPase subunit epsilon
LPIKEDQFAFNIVTPKGTMYQEKVEFVKAASLDGEIGILADHSPALIELKDGDILAKNQQNNDSFTITNGFLYIMPEKTLLLCSSCINNNI